MMNNEISKAVLLRENKYVSSMQMTYKLKRNREVVSRAYAHEANSQKFVKIALTATNTVNMQYAISSYTCLQDRVT